VFDTDGNGSLSAEELVAILTRSSGGAALSTEQAEALIKQFDTNNDGELQLEEFCGEQVELDPRPAPHAASCVFFASLIDCRARLGGTRSLLTAQG
jgi:hypothetical protein